MREGLFPGPFIRLRFYYLPYLLHVVVVFLFVDSLAPLLEIVKGLRIDTADNAVFVLLIKVVHKRNETSLDHCVSETRWQY